MIDLDALAAYALRTLMVFGWLAVVVMAAHGSVHLHFAYPVDVAIRVLGFGMLVFCTSTLGASLWEGA